MICWKFEESLPLFLLKILKLFSTFEQFNERSKSFSFVKGCAIYLRLFRP